MFTVTELARRCNLSRATILYYEREGLLLPATRSQNGYRWYGEKELKKLEAISAYRSYGLPIASIKKLLDEEQSSSQSNLLKDHFYSLENEIEKLKRQQRAIVAFLEDEQLADSTLNKEMMKGLSVNQGRVVTKERWVEIMRASGFDDKDMRIWHQRFEAMEPEEHQKFLESLGIGPEEIKEIRAY